MSYVNAEHYKGIIIALYGCFKKDTYELDTEAVKRLTEFYLDKGVTGLYVGGSSGEGLLQSVDERKKTLEAVMSVAKGKLTIIVHVGAMNTADSIALAEHAKQQGADAVSAIPCAFYRLPERSIKKHWQSIIDATDLPFIIYNIPQLSGYDLSMSMLREMAQNPKVIGIKNTSMSTYQTQQFKTKAGKDFLLFNGPDEQYLAGRIMGADAGIGGTYGIMPELFVRMEKYYDSGDLEMAQELQFAISDIATELFAFPCIYGAAKDILRLRGVDIGVVRPPFEQVDECQKEDVKNLYELIMESIKKYC